MKTPRAPMGASLARGSIPFPYLIVKGLVIMSVYTHAGADNTDLITRPWGSSVMAPDGRACSSHVRIVSKHLTEMPTITPTAKLMTGPCGPTLVAVRWSIGANVWQR